MTRSGVHIQWGARPESVDSAADQVAHLVERLAEIDPLLSNWRGLGRSRKQALAQPPVTTDHDELVKRLLAGRNRRDTDKTVIEDLGYSVYWWNGRDDDSANIDVSIGVTSNHVNNSIAINLPDSDAAPNLYTAVTARNLIVALCDLFAPDFAIWSEGALTDEQCEPDRPIDGGGIAYGKLIGRAAGWATYLAASASDQFDLAKLPKSTIAQRVANGTLVLVGDDPADPPLEDVLRVRLAMGYDVPRHPELAAERRATSSAGIGTGHALPDGAFRQQSVQERRETAEGVSPTREEVSGE